MNRRAFFSSLAAIAAGAVLDPERLLWRPGRKLISIPRQGIIGPEIPWLIPIYVITREALVERWP
jgi:hypothetical protein